MTLHVLKKWIAGALFGLAALAAGSARAAITSMNVTNDATNITYAFQYSSSGTHYHAFIDKDAQFTTGYKTTYGVGAEYLIEDGHLYSWAGSGFNWNPVADVTASNGPNTIVWTFARSLIGETNCTSETARVAFEVTKSSGPAEVSMLLTHNYIPCSGALTNDRTTNDATNVYYRMSYSSTWTLYHVFIDADQNPGTGYATNGIGADYFLEGGTLRHHIGGSGDWTWDNATAVTYGNSAGLATWAVPRSAMGETASDERADVVYHVQVTGTQVALPKRSHYYYDGTGLPKVQAAAALVPLYVYPTDPSWSTILSAHAQNPSVPITVIVNPATGPGTTVDPNYTTGITNFRNASINVAGYVFTTQATRAAASVDADVDKWKQLYPNVNGIFFDEMSATTDAPLTKETYYQQRTAHAKAQGFTYTIGNAGSDLPPTYVGTVDTIVVYEHSGIIPMSNWWASYPRNGFAVLAYNVPLDTAFLASAKQRAGYVYLNDRATSPWNGLTSYFSSLLAQLAISQ